MTTVQTDDSRAPHGVSVEVSGARMVFEGQGNAVEALAEVDLNIPAGRFCSVVGPSGCGKSTLLMLIAGLYRPTEGQVLVDRRPLTGPYTDVGIVFQQDVLLPWRSVLDNVTLPAQVKHRPSDEARERAEQLLERVGLTGFESRFPSELSGGMRQRVALCRALLHDPPVLLMDEPFGALDALTRERLQADITKLWAGDTKTVLFITHDIEEAVLLSDEVVVMSQRPGRILHRFPVELAQPRSPETRREPTFNELVEGIRELFRETGIL